MQRVDSYVLPPGECFVCGGAHTPAVDTYRTTEGLRAVSVYGEPVLDATMDGRVVICHHCVAEMVKLLDGSLPVEPAGTSAELRAEIARLTDKLTEITDQSKANADLASATLRAGHLEVTPEVFDSLSPEDQAAVLVRLPEAMAREEAKAPKRGRSKAGAAA